MCTDVLVVSKSKGQVVNARSQEMSEPLGYRVMFRKKGVMVQISQPTRPPGDQPFTLAQTLANPTTVDLCESKYDYLGIMITTERDQGGIPAGTPISTSVFDGMNSVGLSAGGLNAPGSKYQQALPAEGRTNLFIGFFVDWLLSNFANCEEVKKAFEDGSLRVVAENTGGFSNAEVEKHVHMHYAVHDAGGNSLVIEFIDHQAVLTDNPIGVLTNLPVFSWHLTNLGMYAHLSNFSTDHHEKVDFAFGAVTHAPPGSLSPEPQNKMPQYRTTGIPGMGDGLAGIPGDFRPASRFVRTAYMKKFAVPPGTENEAVSDAFHLLNGVDMVKGASAEKVNGVDKYDTAQCVMVKDLINRKFYVRMYESPMPYSIAFDQCPPFAPGSPDRPEGVELAIPTEHLAKPLFP